MNLNLFTNWKLKSEFWSIYNKVKTEINSHLLIKREIAIHLLTMKRYNNKITIYWVWYINVAGTYINLSKAKFDSNFILIGINKLNNTNRIFYWFIH